jgi:excinuclease ABC subunit C
METLEAKKENLAHIPLIPGVYLFKLNSGKVIYVGKAKLLRNRLRSYWAVNLINKTKQMMDDAQLLSYIPVSSEFEALLLESALVKKYRPKYNIELKDDKSPLYIGITKEPYPRVLTFRQTQLEERELKET